MKFVSKADVFDWKMTALPLVNNPVGDAVYLGSESIISRQTDRVREWVFHSLNRPERGVQG